MYRTTNERFYLGFSLLLALLCGTPYVGVGMSTDYHLLFLFLLLLSDERLWNRYPRLTPLILGTVSGFCLLTKFSLGIYTLGSLILYLAGNWFKSILQRSWIDLFNQSVGITIALLAAFSTAYILHVSANAKLHLKSILLYLLVAGLLGILLYSWQGRSPHPSGDNSLLPWSVFTGIYSLLLLYHIATNSSFYLVDYLVSSLQISSGYSSAMSLLGPSQNLFIGSVFLLIGLICVFLMILLLFVSATRRNWGLSLAFLFITWISFKHGFVRQDKHMIVFFMTLPFLSTLLYLKISSFFCLEETAKYCHLVSICYLSRKCVGITSGILSFIS